jgi:Tfp pilus assembly protein PilX
VKNVFFTTRSVDASAAFQAAPARLRPAELGVLVGRLDLAKSRISFTPARDVLSMTSGL